jgi:IS30 family transposase
MAKHKDFTVATDVKVYFCDPQSPWQRGSNENTNLLLRQYFPRGTDLSVHSQVQLDQVALRLNQRPRKTLGFETPASKLQASVASTSEPARLTRQVESLPDCPVSQAGIALWV